MGKKEYMIRRKINRKLELMIYKIMKKGILISCRTASKLPNKAVLPINKKPSIFYLFENLNNSIYKDNLILCTTNFGDDV